MGFASVAVRSVAANPVGRLLGCDLSLGARLLLAP